MANRYYLSTIKLYIQLVYTHTDENDRTVGEKYISNATSQL